MSAEPNPKTNTTDNRSQRILRSSTTTTELPTAQNQPSTNPQEQPAKCHICQAVFISNDDQLVLCDRCDEWICLPCSGLSITQYEAIDANLTWYCPECKLPATQAVKTDKSIEEKCKSYFDIFKVEFREEIDSKLNEIRKDISELKTNQSNIHETDDKLKKAVAESMKKQEDEISEREKRKSNLILFNVSEAQTNIKDERIIYDKTIFKEICDTICDEPLNINNISDARRLGKKSPDATDSKPRPLIIKLKDQSLKIPILRNANKLRSIEDPRLDGIRMGHDLTTTERENSKQMYEEAKRRQRDETSPGYRYKVRGPPWDMKIVRVKATD